VDLNIFSPYFSISVLKYLNFITKVLYEHYYTAFFKIEYLMIEMKKQLELLKMLKALKYMNGGSATALQKAAGIGNYYAAKMILAYLKDKGLVEEKYDPGPPGKIIYTLTDKGEKATTLAIKLLELLEENK